MKDASKLFGGDKNLIRSLFARITAIEQAVVLKDIVMMPAFHFHKLQGKLDGYFADYAALSEHARKRVPRMLIAF